MKSKLFLFFILIGFLTGSFFYFSDNHSSIQPFLIENIEERESIIKDIDKIMSNDMTFEKLSKSDKTLYIDLIIKFYEKSSDFEKLIGQLPEETINTHYPLYNKDRINFYNKKVNIYRELKNEF